MDKTKEVIKYWNENQDEWKVEHIENKAVRIHEIHNAHTVVSIIGFYEWLFNPKYKVFEVFGINLTKAFYRVNILDVNNELIRNNSSCVNIFSTAKTPPEIIKYLGKQGKNE